MSIPTIPNLTPTALVRLKQLAANPKALNLKDLEVARTDAHVLHRWHGDYTPCLTRYIKVLDAEYTSRLSTFFPLLLDAARAAAVANGIGQGLTMLELRTLIARIDAPIQPPAPSFKVGDYVVPTDDAPSWMKGVYQIALIVSSTHKPPHVRLANMENPDYDHAMTYLRLATSDEIRAHLLTTAAKQGYVIGAWAFCNQGNTSVIHIIKSVHVWLPEDRRVAWSAYGQEAANLGKPFVYLVSEAYGTGTQWPLSYMTLVPEPTHYLYRIWMDGDTVGRALHVSGPLKDLTKMAADLNHDIKRYEAEGLYKVYDREMPGRRGRLPRLAHGNDGPRHLST